MSENKGIWLPEAVLELADLSPTEKMLFAAILPLTFTEPCWAGNEYLAKRIGVSEQTVTNNLGTLHNKGYIRIYLDRTGGTTRKIHTFILEDTLYKYIGDPISKFDTPLYKDFIQGISKSYIGCIKSLSTLYKDFIFTYKDDSKEDKKEDSKEIKQYKKRESAYEPFWSVIKVIGGVYESWQTYEAFVAKEKRKKPPRLREAPPVVNPDQFAYEHEAKKWDVVDWPNSFTPEMRLFYIDTWLPYHRKRSGKRLTTKGVRGQLKELAVLDEYSFDQCLNKAINSNWQSFHAKPVTSNANNRATPAFGFPGNQAAKPYEFDLDAELAKRSVGHYHSTGVYDTDVQIVD